MSLAPICRRNVHQATMFGPCHIKGFLQGVNFHYRRTINLKRNFPNSKSPPPQTESLANKLFVTAVLILDIFILLLNAAY